VASPITVGSTRNFQLTATKDGAAWDLTGATVTLAFAPPAASGLPPFTRPATVTDGPGGVAGYVSTPSDLTVTGLWQREWAVADGGVSVSLGLIPFFVYN